MNLLLIALKITLASAVLLAYYALFLRNRRFHYYNRFFLLGSLCLSMLLGFVRISLPAPEPGRSSPALLQAIRVISVEHTPEEFSPQAMQNQDTGSFSPAQAGLLVYSLVSLILLAGLVHTVLYLLRLRRQNPSRTFRNIRLYDTVEPGTPFSWFRSLFWNRRLDLHSAAGQRIFRHERYHIREWHSLDNLLAEICCALAWFNPFFFLIRRELKVVHEFLADQHSCSPNDRLGYAALLVQHNQQKADKNLVHPFFQHALKRRIAMITPTQHRPLSYRSRILALPLAALLFCLIAFTTRPTNAESRTAEPFASDHPLHSPLTVIIDAGHGGTDAGARNNGLLEKDLALSIARKIARAAADYQIRVLMTRENDQFPSLAQRTALAEKEHADLFLSIHLASAPAETSTSSPGGFEVYVSGRNPAYFQQSAVLGNLLLNAINDIYPARDRYQQRQSKGIWVLDKAPCPAALLECGYLSNARDRAFITDEENQRAIAQKILESIRAFGDQQFAKTARVEALSNAANAQDTAMPEPIFVKAEQPPYYPGGETALMQFLAQNLQYPEEARQNGLEGKVTVQFMVNRQGSLYNIRALDGPEALRAEACRLIRLTHNWNPALQNGHIVSCYIKQPVWFRLAKTASGSRSSTRK